TLQRAARLEERLGAAPVPLEGLIAAQRVVKRPFEVELLREAARITDAAFAAVLEFVRAGVSEAEVGLELERAMGRAGAGRPSFETIAAAGTRGAMPHGTASAKRIGSGELVTFDFGAA